MVITGVSGSGKSTLAFDLIFAEGQRRFLDSMNVYARQFVEQMVRPDVDLITGIPPTVSIEQRNSRGGGKSTVATVTEIYHFVRLLFARLGTQYCPDCQLPVEAQTRDELGARLQKELKTRGDLLLLRASREESQRLSFRRRRMGGEAWLRGDSRGWENLLHERVVSSRSFSRTRCGNCDGCFGTENPFNHKTSATAHRRNVEARSRDVACLG